jgi:hypothetical protein
MRKGQKRNPPVILEGVYQLSHAQARIMLRILEGAMMSYDIGSNRSELNAADRMRLQEGTEKLGSAINMATIYPIGKAVAESPHRHLCERCRLPYECGNSPDECELSNVEGYCCQACYDRGPR